MVRLDSMTHFLKYDKQDSITTFIRILVLSVMGMEGKNRNETIWPLAAFLALYAIMGNRPTNP